MQIWIENITRLIVVTLLQLLLVNNLWLWGLMHPFVYILFLLALPATLNRYWLMLAGFATGLMMDVFCNSPGVHTAACTAICFIRQMLIGSLVQEDERLTGTINSWSLGWESYIKYVIIMVLLHHLLVFVLEAFSFHAFWLTLLQTLLSSIVTVALLLGWEVAKAR